MTIISHAFAVLAGAVASLHSLADNATDAECEPFNLIIDQARSIIKTTPANGPLDIACKLRMALAGIDQERDDELILYRVIPSEDLPRADYFEDVVFAVIRQLEGEAA